MGFTQAFIPPVHFDLPELTLADWRRALRRYKPKAAVGVDGFSHVDLKMMPDSLASQLVEHLAKIESGEMTWPKQLLYGNYTAWPNDLLQHCLTIIVQLLSSA